MTNECSCSLTDEFLTHLGYDWLLLFLQSHLHPRTIVLAMKLLIAFLLSSSNALTRFRDSAMLLMNSSMGNAALTNNNSAASANLAQTSIPSLTTTSESWINVFNDRQINKPAFPLSIDPTLALTNNSTASIALPGFVLLQHILAQRAEIVPIYYQLTAFLFRQCPSDDVMEQIEVRISYEKLIHS